jgi:radical SAM protein with 4Fe4S-binding SPASM domain
MNKITERIDAVTAIAPEYRKTFLPAPKSVKIELTGRCNFHCSFCARSAKLREQKDMDRALFEELTAEMRDDGVQEIGLFYLGESFLVSWLPEAIDYCKNDLCFPYVFLTTNGSLATEARVEKCFRAGLDSLKFSFNYADAEQFKEISGMPEKLFHYMLGNVKAARAVRDRVAAELGHRCTLSASYILYEGKQHERMMSAVAEIESYVDEVYALPLYSQAEHVGDAERKRGWEVTAGNRGRVGALREPLPCWATLTEGHITSDGKLSACCFDHDGRFEMGDLTTESFMNCWNSEKFQQLREAHLRKDVRGTVCEKCAAGG